MKFYLKFVGIVELAGAQKLLAHDLDYAVLELFLEGEVFARGIQFVQQFSASANERSLHGMTIVETKTYF